MAKRAPSDTVQVKIRMKSVLREKLATEAEAAGFSLSSEMSRRLEQSFNVSDIVMEAMGGEDLGIIMEFIRSTRATFDEIDEDGKIFEDPEYTRDFLDALTHAFNLISQKSPEYVAPARKTSGRARAAGAVVAAHLTNQAALAGVGDLTGFDAIADEIEQAYLVDKKAKILR